MEAATVKSGGMGVGGEGGTGGDKKNTHGYVPIKLYLWTLNLEFHINFDMSENIILVFVFPNHLNMQKPFLSGGLDLAHGLSHACCRIELLSVVQR